METWFILSIIAMLAYGLQNFIQKVSAEKKCDSVLVLLIQLAVGVSVIVPAFIFIDSSVFNLRFMILFALLHGVIFVIGKTLKIESMKYIDLLISHPITRIHGALAALVGILFLGEVVTSTHALGILLSVAVIGIVLYERREHFHSRTVKIGIGLSILTALFTAGMDVVVKIVASQVNLFAYLLLVYAVSIPFGILVQKKFKNAERNTASRATTIKVGLGMGVTGIIGFLSLLYALRMGPISLIIPITTLSFPLTILFAVLVYKEEVTLGRVAAIVVSLISLILLGL